MADVNKVLEALATIAEAAEPLLPTEFQRPLAVTRLVISDAAGRGSGFNAEGIKLLAAQGAAAGEAAHRSAGLAGMRYAFERVLVEYYSPVTHADASRVRACAGALMVEVLKRWPS
jgi:hypothetical protein